MNEFCVKQLFYAIHVFVFGNKTLWPSVRNAGGYKIFYLDIFFKILSTQECLQVKEKSENLYIDKLEKPFHHWQQMTDNFSSIYRRLFCCCCFVRWPPAYRNRRLRGEGIGRKCTASIWRSTTGAVVELASRFLHNFYFNRKVRCPGTLSLSHVLAFSREDFLRHWFYVWNDRSTWMEQSNLLSIH